MRTLLLLTLLYHVGCIYPADTNDLGDAEDAGEAGDGGVGPCPSLPKPLACGANRQKCSAPFWIRGSDAIAPCTIIYCEGQAKGQWERTDCM